MTKRIKARVVVVEAAAAAAAWQQQSASDNSSLRTAAPVDKSTAPVVGLLPEAAQLGCLPGPETALITSSLVRSLVGSTRWSSGTGAGICPCVWVVVSFPFFARTSHDVIINNAANNAGKARKHDILRKLRETKGQPTDRGIHTLTGDFSTLTREKCHGSSLPDPHETRISQVTRIVSGQVGSGQEDFKPSRVGSGEEVFKISLVGSGRVGSGQDVSKFSGVRSGRVKTFRNLNVSGRVS